jgi:hypothetical protein
MIFLTTYHYRQKNLVFIINNSYFSIKHINLIKLPAALAPTINTGTGLPTAFISFGCPKETEPKKRHHETQPEISFVAQPNAAQWPRNFRFARFVDVPRTIFACIILYILNALILEKDLGQGLYLCGNEFNILPYQYRC